MKKHIQDIYDIIKKNNDSIDKECSCYTLTEDQITFKACDEAQCCSKSNINNLVSEITGYLILNNIPYTMNKDNDIIFNQA